MVTTTLTQHCPDRARPASAHARRHVTGLSMTSWCGGSTTPAPLGRGTTGLESFVAKAYATETNRTAGAVNQFIKRPTRPLETRST